MDIEILLILQNFRETCGSFLNSFFAFITTVAVDYYIIVPAMILFWVVDKKKGARVLMSFGLSLGIGALLKSIFCVYRPWVRDDRVKPLESVVSGATGYSFPSGHCFGSSGFYCAIISVYRKYKAICWFCVTMILLTMFSRCYVGVHTPQDVIVGALIGLCSAFIVSKAMDYIDKHPEKDWMVLAGIIIYCAILLPYIYFKKYPMDYVDGVLLVDPKKMTVDGFKDPGRCFGLFLGWFIERRFIHFDTEADISTKVARSLIGGLLLVFYWTAIITPLGKALDNSFAYFFLQASIPIVFMDIYPLFFKKKKN